MKIPKKQRNDKFYLSIEHIGKKSDKTHSGIKKKNDRGT